MVSKGPSAHLGWVLAPGTHMGWEEMDGQSVIQRPALPGVWPGLGQGNPDRFRHWVPVETQPWPGQGAAGGPPPHRTTQERVTPWLGCPQSLFGPWGDGEPARPRHGSRCRWVPQGTALTRCRLVGGLLGDVAQREGEGRGYFSPPIAGTQVPRLLPCLGDGQCQPGGHKGWGRCALCPPLSGAGDCSRQQGQRFDTHILYSCKQHKSAWLLFP